MEELIHEKDVANQMLKEAEKKEQEVVLKYKSNEIKEEKENKIKEVQQEKQSINEADALKSSIMEAVNKVEIAHKQNSDQEK